MTKKDSEEKKDSLNNELLETRTIIISGSVDSKLADKVITQMLLMEKKSPKKDIKFLINSPGGEVHSGFAIFDIMKMIPCPITTIVMGLAASMGSILSLAGDDGKRLALPNSRIMIHQPLLSGAEGQATDLEIHSKEILKTRKLIAQFYSDITGKSVNQVMKDMDRDHWLTPEEAVKYGLIDKIISSRADI